MKDVITRHSPSHETSPPRQRIQVNSSQSFLFDTLMTDEDGPTEGVISHHNSTAGTGSSLRHATRRKRKDCT
ncbi:hypothetical protein BDP27DRAFT_1309620 [Rhodocollybia butyracea]|uniref:Uncharacterized protein n=1 Tax=Rhodocollybia butyracea TaxID=206335 RepID=A0A9P5UFM7_9AGAR|nr:hypothetical protein BDP27DRAFT_1309620 [Rhodocollybia butyracea]